MPDPDLEIREVGVGVGVGVWALGVVVGGGGVGGERSLKIFSQFGPKVRGGRAPSLLPWIPH